MDAQNVCELVSGGGARCPVAPSDRPRPSGPSDSRMMDAARAGVVAVTRVRTHPASRPMTAENVPAVVLYSGRRAVVLHRDGETHPNAVATVRRLERRGYACGAVPSDVALFLADAPADVRDRARQILRTLAVGA